MEVYLFDESDVILLTLWNDFIDSVKTGPYKISNAIVRVLHDDDKVLATGPETIFEVTTKKFILKPAPKLYRQAKFPLADVAIVNRQLKCHKCGKDVNHLTPDCEFVKCVCGVISRSSQLKVNRIAKVTTQDNKEEITIFQPQLFEYALKYKLAGNNEEALTIALLKDSETSFIIDRHDICICFL
ncbi:uncharacterized protein LOC130641613 [Hydractinia symbiolongicarpus]|uniref:uncharacterized protein LOC130641613 n=1 Tax=Hydractinia symbiolongicarpus TaxID=13093 RepID=UPI00254A9639|nr:uncharacterized protein LOC130641613 [Hydractinia symbiolongicarpus]